MSTINLYFKLTSPTSLLSPRFFCVALPINIFVLDGAKDLYLFGELMFAVLQLANDVYNQMVNQNSETTSLLLQG